MKILLTEHNVSPETPIIIQQGLEKSYAPDFSLLIPKEDVKDVHEFGRAELLQVIKENQPDVLMVGLKFVIDEEILDSAPIKAVFTQTTGVDHIDSEHCKTKGIEVINLKGDELTDVVAVPELCIQMMLLLFRKDRREVRGKTLGIVGYGRIGRRFGEYVRALGMNVLHFDRADSPPVLDTLLKTSDIVSIHINSVEENRGFFNSEKFNLMKEGAYFMNSSRSWLVEGLQEALGKLAGAWVDFEMPFKHPRLITTPHIGGSTIESRIKTEELTARKIVKKYETVISSNE